MDGTYALGPGQIFTVFFIMLGPFQLLQPFAKATKDMSQSQVISLAVKSVLAVIPILIVLGLCGRTLMENWNIPRAVLELTAGLIFAYVAFSIVLTGKQKTEPKSEESKEPVPVTALGVAMKMVVSAHGLATLIVLLAVSKDYERTFLIFGVLVVVMILNLLTMIYKKIFLGKVGAAAMQVFGVVLGVMQAGMALAIIHYSLMELHKGFFS
ncbi:MarC family protein [Bdellovibrio bacteriovorus]|uniref:MarC family protein n=1 Tax=Bdellovibrio bacteriovorus TaxID=959 RepID=UPI003AA7E445